MLGSAGSRIACLSAFMLLGLVAGAGTAMAQTQQPTPPLPSPAPVENPSAGTLEGSVEKVDPGAGTIQVSAGSAGVLAKTLEVTDWTEIQVEGRQGILAEIREGAMVKAAYESHQGTDIATRIDVIPALKK